MKANRLFSILAVAMMAVSACRQSDLTAIAGYSREIKASDPITVTLAEQFLPAGNQEIAAAALKAVTISPKTAFTAEVMDSQTLCLYPSERLEYNKNYKVSVSTAKLTGRRGRASFDVKVLAPVLLFDFSQLQSDLEQEGVYCISVSLTSSDPLDAKYLESGMNVRGTDAAVRWGHSDDGLVHSLVIDGIRAGKEGSKVELQYDFPSYATEGRRSYDIPAAGTFSVVSSEVLSEPYMYQVAFSSLLDRSQDFSELVSMPGAGALNFSVDRNILTVRPSIKAQESQFMSISKGVRSACGSKLAEDFERYFVIPSGEPSIAFISKGSILPSASMEIGFRSINYAKAEIRVKRIFENNILQFFQNSGLDDAYCYTGNVARTVLDTTITLGEINSPKLRNLTDYGLNISELIRPERGAIYRIEIKGVEPLAEFLNERWESDYYFGSYEDYEARVRNILVSNLNIIVKSSGTGDCNVYVTDIISASPVSGAKVKVFDSVNQTIAEGTTGSDGLFTCKPRNDEPYTVMAVSGQDKSYINLRKPISLSNFDVSGTSSQNGQRGFIFGERGVWRPGDDIHITFVSKLDEGVLPAGHPVTAVLRNPQGQAIMTLVNKDGHDGMYAFNFKTDANAPTGNWQVDVTVGGETFSKTVKVETVKPNNIVIGLTLNDKPAVPASAVRGDITAKWLVGAPAKGLKTRVEVALSRAKTAFKAYKGYTFEDPSRNFTTEEKQLCEVTTDAVGKAHFNTVIGHSKHAPGFLTGVFTTRIFEAGGDFSIDRFTATVSPYDTYIGLKAPEVKNDWDEDYLDINRTHTFSVVAVDAAGNPVSKGVNAEVEVYRMGWNWWWSSSSDGLASYAKDSYNTPYETLKFRIENGSGSFKLDFSDQGSGMYLIRVTDLAGGHAAAKVVTVSGHDEHYYDSSSQSASRLQLKIDRQTARPGETAVVTIPSSAGARALVTVEKGRRVLRSFWVDCNDITTDIPVNIEADMAPDIYVSVMLIQPYNNSLNDAPIRLFGVQRINVEDPASHLNPVVDIPAEIKPESEVSFSVREKDGRPMSYVVALVDEGLLSLTRFKTPNPWDSFYATEALGVSTCDLFDLIIGAYGARMEKMFAIGGDAETLVTPNSKAERFKPISMFLGPFTLKARGSGRHSVKIPQYIGNLRVMVISTDGKAMGASEKNVLVTKPVMVKATLPRVIGTDEEIAMPVTVFAMKDNIGKINVEYTVEGPLSAAGEKAASVNIARAGEEVVNFKLKSGSEEGVARIKVTARNGSDVSVENIEIDVRNPNPPVTTMVSKLVDGGVRTSLELASAGRPGTNAVNVEASTIPPINLGNHLNYLIEYPHGCVEQTVSAVFPQLYLSSLRELDSKSAAKCEKNIKDAIAKLPSFAIATGGMTCWPGTSATAGAHVWGTIYATHFMEEAQAQGYAVPTSLYRNNLKYLRTVASSKSFAAGSRAYACYVLALAGSASRGDMNRLKEDVDKLPASACWYLAAAYATDGKKDVAKSIVSTIKKGSGTYDAFSDSFDSEERDMAVAAIAFKAIGNRTESFKCVEALSKWLNDSRHYMSTQSTAWALNAVSNYMKGNTADKMDVAVSTTSEKVTLKGASAIATSVLKDGKVPTMKVEVTNSSKSPVYVTLSSRGIPEKGEEVAQANGVRITLTYTLPDGTAVNPAELEQGTDFYVNAFVNNLSATRDYTNMSLTQIFPAGWELDRTRAAGFYQDFRDDRVNTYFDIKANGSVTVRTKVTATYAGRFYLPSTVCEAMYDNSINASTLGQWCTVK